jgi:hypothetical protein
MVKSALAAALFLATAAHAAPPSGAPSVAADRWWSHVTELADDKYEGRLTGTPGYQRAADYTAAQFKALGLKPAGEGGTYFQTVRFEEQVVDQGASKVSVNGKPLAVGPDLLIGRQPQLKDVRDAPMVFIGYGLHLPDAGYDDFAGQDLRGKIVVYVNGGPSNLSGALKSHARAAEFWPAMERAGAVGAIALSNPKSSDIPWERQRLLAGQSGMVLADPALRDAKQRHFVATFNPAEADKLFADTGHSFAELIALQEKGVALPRFDIGKTLSADVAYSTREVSAPNVAAMLPGSDPKLASEYVVLTAHLDHLGVGAPINGDRVYNGAMDNASGVASLIETARVLKAKRPKRSVVFVAVCAEERGLLGSRYYANRPTVASAAIVADVNMDMFLPLFPLKTMVAYGADESSLGPVARAAAAAHGLTLVPDPAPDRNIFTRSDQYSFVRTGVPSLMLKFEGVTPEQKGLEAAFLKSRYHAPSDDTAQPLDKAAAATFNTYLADVITRVADAPTRPQWNSDSFFKRFARGGGAAIAGR